MNLRKNFELFCLRNRDKGIPNLMLYIVLGSGLVYLLSLINGGFVLYEWLCFDKAAILRGQIWRLFTYVFTYTPGSNTFLVLIGLYFFYHLGRTVEQHMGTLRFNLYYFSGMLMMSLFAMIFCPSKMVIADGVPIPAEYFTYTVYSNMAWFLHLSIVLTFCVLSPDSTFLVFFILPVKAWFLSLIDLVLIGISIYNMSYPIFLFPHNLFPLVGLANFLLYAGKDVLYLLPPAIRPIPQRGNHAKKTKTKPAKPIPFPGAEKRAEVKASGPYNHCCAVCGRTDVSHPDLEFRYCSRCNGYHCYCIDHINNHTHVESSSL